MVAFYGRMMETGLGRQDSPTLWLGVNPRGHVCQLYGGEDELLDTLTGFVGGGLWTGEGVVVIATRRHTTALEARLRESGLDLAHFRSDDRFVSLSAEQTLDRISIDGMPTWERLEAVADEAMARAGRGGRKVRAYGEMVNVLWLDGRYQAAIHLEGLWNRYLAARDVPLLCAYASSGFHAAGPEAVRAVERAHTVFVS